MPHGLGDLQARVGTPLIAVGDLVGRAPRRGPPAAGRVAERDAAGHLPAAVGRDTQDLEGLPLETGQHRRQRAAHAVGARSALTTVLAYRKRETFEVLGVPADSGW